MTTPLELRKIALEAARKHASKNTGGNRMKGKVGIITGVGPPLGIGTATAKVMAKEEVENLYLLDMNGSALKSFAESLQHEFASTKVTHVQGDAASPAVISKLVARALSEEGHLDFFFANAGILELRRRDASKKKTSKDPAAKVEEEMQKQEDDFIEVMRINAMSTFLAVKYAAPAMRKLCPEKGKTVAGGSIFLTASVAGLRANAGPIPYSASKAAVISIAQTSASALTGQNIRVNAICPGLIETDMTKKLFELAEQKGVGDQMGKLNPMLRYGLGSEIAHMALFLASDDSSYVNGQAMVVDGGLNASMPFVSSRL